MHIFSSVLTEKGQCFNLNKMFSPDLVGPSNSSPKEKGAKQGREEGETSSYTNIFILQVVAQSPRIRKLSMNPGTLIGTICYFSLSRS